MAEQITDDEANEERKELAELLKKLAKCGDPATIRKFLEFIKDL